MTAPAPAPAAPPTTEAAGPAQTGQQPAGPAFQAPVVPPGATVAPANTAPTAAPPTGPDGQPYPDWMSDPAQVFTVMNKLRGEQAKDRTQAKETAAAEAAQKARDDVMQTLGRALGFVKDDEPVTAEQLTQQFTAKESGYQSQIRQLRIDNALLQALANTQPGTRDALIGSGKLAELDPAADDFQGQLQAKVDEYLTAHPYFRVQAATAPAVPAPPQAGVSGGDFAGGTGQHPEIDALIAAAETAGNHREAIRLKRLKARNSTA